MENKKPKPPSERLWEKAAASLAMSYCPPIYSCKKCRWPVIDGYVCHYCGDDNPKYTEEEEDIEYGNG